MFAKRAIAGLTVGAGAGVLMSMRKSIEEETTHPHKLLTTLQENRQFTQLQADQNFEQQTLNPLTSLAETGGLSARQVFVDKVNKGHTITYVYAGSRTTGFPFVVHGGILGTIVDDAFNVAAQNFKPWEKLTLQYKRPTLANQFLIIETQRQNDKYTAEIRNLKGNVLVQSEAV